MKLREGGSFAWIYKKERKEEEEEEEEARRRRRRRRRSQRRKMKNGFSDFSSSSSSSSPLPRPRPRPPAAVRLYCIEFFLSLLAFEICTQMWCLAFQYLHED